MQKTLNFDPEDMITYILAIFSWLIKAKKIVNTIENKNEKTFLFVCLAPRRLSCPYLAFLARVPMAASFSCSKLASVGGVGNTRFLCHCGSAPC